MTASDNLYDAAPEFAAIAAVYAASSTNRAAWFALSDSDPAGVRAYLNARSARAAAEIEANYFHVVIEHGPRERVAIDFGAADKKGRAIGCSIARYTTTVRELTAEERAARPHGCMLWKRDRGLGEFLTWSARATRAGSAFGACTGAGADCRTDAEREAGIEKYLASARKRAVAGK